MRLHFILNNGTSPQAKLADVEIHFDETSFLGEMKLVGISIWRSRRGGDPTILTPSRTYATAGGIRYYDLLRPSDDHMDERLRNERIEGFKDLVRDEYLKFIASLPATKPSK